MNILFIGKRHPQQRDLIERPYGRFFHLPTALAVADHDVRVQLCSHRKFASLETQREGVTWSSHDIRTLGPLRFLRAIENEARVFKPDWIVGMSDAQYGWLAHRLSRRLGARLAVDAYDNYEAYMPWNAPLHWAWRRAVCAAQVVTAAGPQLAARLQSHRCDGRSVDVLPMTADPDFVPHDRDECRRALNLPTDAPLLGYIGSWTQSRGTHLILDAFARVRSERPDARLVLSGRPPPEALAAPGVIGLGYLPDAQLPLLVSALDVACIVVADTAFGRYSYPAKLCEAMACKAPVVASTTEAVRWMLDDRAEHLARIGDPEDFARRALKLLESPSRDYAPLPSWDELGQRFAQWLVETF